MSRWLAVVLARIHQLTFAGKVEFTHKALFELADLGLDVDDALEVLTALSVGDSAERMRSERTREWIYIFKPRVAETVLYLKLILRADCVVVSFHEEGDRED